jgi:HSP20 family molecular chaperone IbpA
MSRHVVAPWELALIERHLAELFEALARAADAPAGGWAPPVDLIDRGDGFVARVDLPGIAGPDVEIELHERELHIRGTKRPAERGGEPRRCLRVERSFGGFALHVHLPASVVPERCRAVLCHGVLEIALPRVEQRHAPAHRIQLTAEEP